jgi:UDP-N-acetylmuramoyl-tripeptide--D-alanyl-D-alanine ligase
LRKGEVFVALHSEHRDGHDFLEDALVAGASAALVDHPIEGINLPQLLVKDTLKAFQEIALKYRQGFEGDVIAITGSCGKTSTKELLSHLLGEFNILKTSGNLNNHIGVPLTLVSIDPLVHHYAIVEAGINHPGEMDLLADMIAPDRAIVTNIASAHLEGLGDKSTVAEEKAKLLAAIDLPERRYFPYKILKYPSFRELAVGACVIASSKEVDLSDPLADQITLYRIESTTTDWGLRISLQRTGRRKGYFYLRAMSEGMVQNAVLSICVAQDLGITDATIQLRLLSWAPGEMRGQMQTQGGTHFYVDCYNANPASMKDSFRHVITLYPELPHIYMLGCMNELGVTSEELHYEVGKSLFLRDCDHAYIIGKQAKSFAAGIRFGSDPRATVSVCDTFECMQENMQTLRGKPGIILFKGSRGYELERLLPSDLMTHSKSQC